MALPETTLRAPEDFSRFLATEDPLLIVGGQAVNLWALYYQEATLSLAPFVSRDVDIFGDRETLKSIAKVAGLKPHYFPLSPPNNAVGYIMPKDESEIPLLLEVLRWVNGVSTEDLFLDAVTFTIGTGQVAVKVPSPVILLQAKLANLATLSQDGRQDAKHVRILFQVIPCYLKGLTETVRGGQRSERGLVNCLGRLLDIVTTDQAKKSISELELDAAGLFSTLSTNGLPKVAAFQKHQLPRLNPT